jgi:hypothetical protein
MVVVLVKEQNEDDGGGGGIKFSLERGRPGATWAFALAERGEKPSLTNRAGSGDAARTNVDKG